MQQPEYSHFSCTSFLTCALAGLSLLLSAPQAQANLTFNITSPDNTINQQALADFNLAASRWSNLFTNNITVNLSVDYTNLGIGVLGQTSLDETVFNYADVRSSLLANNSALTLASGSSYNRYLNHTANDPNGANSATPYVSASSTVLMTSADAKALGLLSGSGTQVDATIKFNTLYNFQLDPTKVKGSNQYDFVGVATHEIGHALGFISDVDTIASFNPNQPDTTTGYEATTLDLFRYSTASTASNAIDMTVDNRNKYFSTNGGTTAGALFSNGAGTTDGYQASHWRHNSTNPIGIMDPAAAPGQVLQITQNDINAFNAIGYSVAAVPETSVVMMFGMGFVALGGALRAHRRKK